MTTEPPLIDPAADLQERWLPSPDQIAAGVAVLRTVDEEHRARFMAVVPLAQPGKEFGFWNTGQQVVHLPGVWLGENTTFDEAATCAFPLRAAQQAAEESAQAWLDNQGLTGTVAVAMVYPDGNAAVFESLISLSAHQAEADLGG